MRGRSDDVLHNRRSSDPKVVTLTRRDRHKQLGVSLAASCLLSNFRGPIAPHDTVRQDTGECAGMQWQAGSHGRASQPASSGP